MKGTIKQLSNRKISIAEQYMKSNNVEIVEQAMDGVLHCSKYKSMKSFLTNVDMMQYENLLSNAGFKTLKDLKSLTKEDIIKIDSINVYYMKRLLFKIYTIILMLTNNCQ